MAHIFTTPQLAQIFQVSEAQVRTWAASSGLRFYGTPGGKKRYTEEAVRAFIAANEGMEYATPALEAALRRKDKAPALGLRRAEGDPPPRKKRRRNPPPARKDN